MSKYTDLITNYHAGKPLFVEHVDLSTRPLTDISNAITALITAFDIDTAYGNQLDILGLWIGRTRVVEEPITGIYFSFDTDDIGFDQGVWRGPYDPLEGFTNLSDDVYRMVLKTKIAINHWDGTNGTLPAILDTALAGSGVRMEIVDNQDMTISLLFFAENGIDAVSKEIIAVIKMGYLTVKAAGVYSGGNITTPSTGNKLFGFDTDNDYLSGFDAGAWGVNL
jgi:hypothetical protein